VPRVTEISETLEFVSVLKAIAVFTKGQMTKHCTKDGQVAANGGRLKCWIFKNQRSSASKEANSFSANKGIPSILWSPNVH
jgi:hypothetical protein